MKGTSSRIRIRLMIFGFCFFFSFSDRCVPQLCSAASRCSRWRWPPRTASTVISARFAKKSTEKPSFVSEMAVRGCAGRRARREPQRARPPHSDGGGHEERPRSAPLTVPDARDAFGRGPNGVQEDDDRAEQARARSGAPGEAQVSTDSRAESDAGSADGLPGQCAVGVFACSPFILCLTDFSPVRLPSFVCRTAARSPMFSGRLTSLVRSP